MIISMYVYMCVYVCACAWAGMGMQCHAVKISSQVLWSSYSVYDIREDKCRPTFTITLMGCVKIYIALCHFTFKHSFVSFILHHNSFVTLVKL